MKRQITSDSAMQALGAQVATAIRGGATLELVGDVGAGKTTFVKGLAHGLGVTEDIQSPTFTISRVYDVPDGRRLAHYDFYRLHDAGIMQMELAEATHDEQTITVIEWADTVSAVLPADRLTVRIAATTEETARSIELVAGGDASAKIVEALA